MEASETLEEQETTGDPEAESEDSVAEGEPKPEGQLGEEPESVEGGGEVAPPQGAPAISKEELFRREAQSEKDKRIAAERRMAYLEGLAESSRKPVLSPEPTADPFIAKLNEVEQKVIDEYGEGSTEHEMYQVTRFTAEAEHEKQVGGVAAIYNEFETLPNAFYNVHPILRTDDALFKKFQGEVDLRMASHGGYDNFCKQVSSGNLRLGQNSNRILKGILEDSFRAASGKVTSNNKGKAALERLRKATDTLGSTGGGARPAPEANSGASYRDAYERTQRFNREIFEKFK